MWRIPLLGLLALVTGSFANKFGTSHAFDCDARKLASDFSTSLRSKAPPTPWSSTVAADVADALRLSECAMKGSQQQFPQSRVSSQQQHTGAAASSNLTVVVASDGSDDNNGTLKAPFATLHHARDVLRSRRLSLGGLSTPGNPGSVLLRAGIYYLGTTLELGPLDSQTTFEAYQGEAVVISGGQLLRNVPLAPNGAPGRLSAHVVVDNPAAQQLFVATPADGKLLGVDVTGCRTATALGLGPRLEWAREPNGNSERQLQPDGYALVAGNINGSFPDPPGLHMEVPEPASNSTFFPVFGRDRDPRNVPAGYIWYRVGGGASRFSPPHTFWNGTVAAGLRFNATGGIDRHGRHVSGFNTTGWNTRDSHGGVAHVFHNALWGSWVFALDAFDAATRTLTFLSGGWQESRTGFMGTQPFFVAGVGPALDAPGEWWFDKTSSTLHVQTNASTDSATNGSHEAVVVDLVVPKLRTLVSIRGNAKAATHTAHGCSASASPHVPNVPPGTASSGLAHSITFSGIAFTHSATTQLEAYEVPSPGDWAIHRGGALFVEQAEQIKLHGCAFVRTGGNAVFFSNRVTNSSVTGSRFDHIGDSAFAAVGSGELSDLVSSSSFPDLITYDSNVCSGVGIYGKQSSCVFVALASRTTVRDSVLFNGPRAGININDGAFGGHQLQRSLLFNFVRETQDHGPWNSWDRSCYVMPDRSGSAAPGAVTTVPLWTHLHGNMLMNGPSGNRDLGNLFPSFDHDDGSAFYHVSNNVVVWGGFKNFLGHDKIWTGNLLLYPGRWSGGCLTAWGGPGHVYTNNTCVSQSGMPLQFDSSDGTKPCYIDYHNASSVTNVPKTGNNVYWTPQGTFALACSQNRWNLAELQALGQELGSSVHAGTPPKWQVLARSLLAI
eukprot:m.146017 g.146017  ORF g.146017 m.146017 type:complete len:892 (-) comp17236_c0_seq5:56-2731(-)